MQYGLKDGLRVRAEKGANANCPGCNSELIAKCGDIVVWHWAHAKSSDCDNWYEPESKWHLGWKEKFPESCREIVITDEGHKDFRLTTTIHRADVLYNGVVVEFQKSPISISEAIEREEFYRTMIWVFYQRWETTEISGNQYGDFLYGPRMNRLLSCLTKPIFVDCESRLFRISKFQRHRAYGWFLSRPLTQEIDGLKPRLEQMKNPGGE